MASSSCTRPLVPRADMARGWIEVICGVMFSGKSEELIRRVRRALIARKRVQVFKSHLDERYAGIYHISSHDGRTVEAVPVDTPEQIARAVDEGARGPADSLGGVYVKLIDNPDSSAPNAAAWLRAFDADANGTVFGSGVGVREGGGGADATAGTRV